MQKQIFLIGYLACLYLLLVALWSMKSDKLQGRQSGCDTPTSTSAMLASTVPEHLLGTDELIQGGQHVSFHRNFLYLEK